jgi:putative transposase
MNAALRWVFCKDRRWCQKEEKLSGKKEWQALSKRGKDDQRTHMIAGLVHHQPIAPMGFNGSCKTDVFEAWGEELLIKELKC